jgi:hypothetical protein
MTVIRGVGFAAVEGESDRGTIAELAMAASGKPATAADYQALMENHTPLPGLLERNKKTDPIAALGSEGARKGGGKFGGGKSPASPNGDKLGPKRPFVP